MYISCWCAYAHIARRGL